MPPDLELLYSVDRFGGWSIFGRAIGAAEMKRMILSENIVKWYRERAQGNWAEWAQANPGKAAALNQAAKEWERISNG